MHERCAEGGFVMHEWREHRRRFRHELMAAVKRGPQDTRGDKGLINGTQ